jgi:tetratricopeptide (TPR) repeat protein/tRNA A-37 threonylcarbamoyl transferase component Bud32
VDLKEPGAWCPNCGAKASEGAPRCPVCLHPITAALPSSEPPIRFPTPPTEDAEVTELSAAADAAGVGPASDPPPAASHDSLQPGHAFGHRYQIIRLVGVGGMGAVYQAWDSELGVAVALKMIRPDVSRDPATARTLERRFKHELLLARQVTHKNVVRIHDLGEIDGLKYISMPFVEGSDLATILEQQGKLPVTPALQLARQIAAGLQAAHEAGIVHRDLKPANIMVEHDHALITDFGIARSEAQPVPAGAVGAQPGGRGAGEGLSDDRTYAAATMDGAAVGTIDYMAPEQFKADPVDHRADIYAFGLIVYDMLLGLRRARRKESAFDELTQRVKEAPPSPRAIDPEIPEPLDRVIMRCLQPDPAARYQTTADLVGALDRLDDRGRLLPLVRRLTPRLVAVTSLVVVALLTGTYFVAQRLVKPPVQHAPVSVLIADFLNQTGDPSFERTLEPILKLAMEGAGFISAYDRTAIRNLGVRPVEKLDERAALELAVKQGVNVVISGSLDRQGNRYDVSVRAVQTVTGKEITTETQRASNKTEVLKAVATLATSVREALGDEATSDAGRRFALEALSATSLDAVHEYARGLEALSASRFEEALQRFSNAVKLDPNFGGAYGGMAVASSNLDRRQDAEKYMKAALDHLDSMTERERYRARGFYFSITGDYQACVKEYGDLITRYPADASARNNRSACFSHLRDIPSALAEIRQSVRILPNRTLYQQNLALYLAYGSDYGGAETQARSIKQPGLFALLPLAFAQIGQGRVLDAQETYRALGKVDDQGASYAASGLADVASYEGRYADAALLLTQGTAADLTSKDTDRAADKLVALAYAELLRGRKAAAVAAAEQALTNSQAVKIRFLAGRVFIEAGATERALTMSQGLASGLQASSQAHAKILNGLMALKQNDVRLAIQELSAANGLLDTWIGQYDLGRAYLEGGALLQADSSFERCVKRRGEALSLFLDDEPSYAYFPPVYYYQGRVRDGLNSAKAAESYKAYLDIRGKSTEDLLVPEVRRRAGG